MVTAVLALLEAFRSRARLVAENLALRKMRSAVVHTPAMQTGSTLG